MRCGETYTRQVEIEPRQHEIFGIDLGEGPKRFDMLFGVTVFVLWVLLFYGLTRVVAKELMIFYMLPPILIAFNGVKLNEFQERRKNVEAWFKRIRYALVGHRPIVNMGRGHASRGEFFPLAYRFRWAEMKARIARRKTTRTVHPDPAPHVAIGSPLGTTQSLRLYGDDHLEAVIAKSQAKNSRRAAA